ncbi:MAG: cytochrome c [Planctomycetes bacterium]|nr:cytochrome c [Planctomycetota bacterium]
MQRHGEGLLVFSCVAATLALLAGRCFVAAEEGDRRSPPGIVSWETVSEARVPRTPGLVARGRAVYAARCAGCHGRKGDGKGPASLYLETAPRDFTSGTYKFRTTSQDGMPADLDLFRSISTGFPAYGMPSFRYLAVEDRWALVDHLKSFFPNWERIGAGGEVAVGEEPADDPESPERGRRLYQEKFDCVQCHGPFGRGDGPRAAELKDQWGRPVRPRDFTLGPIWRKAGASRRDTVRLLITGLPGTPMPSQVDQLADPRDLQDLWDVARYVERLESAETGSEK